MQFVDMRNISGTFFDRTHSDLTGTADRARSNLTGLTFV